MDVDIDIMEIKPDISKLFPTLHPEDASDLYPTFPSVDDIIQHEEMESLNGIVADPPDEQDSVYLNLPKTPGELMETLLSKCVSRHGRLTKSGVSKFARLMQHSGSNLAIRSLILHILCISRRTIVNTLCKPLPVWQTLCRWLRECIDDPNLSPHLYGIIHVMNKVSVTLDLLRAVKDGPRILKELSDGDSSSKWGMLAKRVVEKWIIIAQVTKDTLVRQFHECNYCGEHFEKEDDLLAHEVTHLDDTIKSGKRPKKEPRFTCDVCGKGYQQESRYEAHLDKHKEEAGELVERFNCDQCSLVFKSQERLQAHIGRKHDDGNTVRACEECGKEFRSYDGYLDHMKAHRGDTPFKCDYCHKAFVKKQSLIVHMRAHTDERPYVCDICHAAFRRCNHLQAHKNLHSEEKKFVCKECGSAFSQPQNLYYHKQLHSDDKRFVCKYCDMAFPLKVYLKNHMKRWHPGAPLPK